MTVDMNVVKDLLLGIPRQEANSHAGQHQGFEVFWCHPDSDAVKCGDMPGGGWYWQSCQPGCLPDGDACGPFMTSQEAHKDATDGERT